MTSEKIRKLRIEAGLLQRELAEILDVSTSTIKHWESGRQQPDPEHLKALCEYFGEQPTRKPSAPVDNHLAQYSKRCRECQYLWGNRYSGTLLCDYFGRTGELRGCPGGDNCTKFEPRTKRRSYGKDFKI